MLEFMSLEVLNRIFKEKLCDQTVEINLDTTTVISIKFIKTSKRC